MSRPVIGDVLAAAATAPVKRRTSQHRAQTVDPIAVDPAVLAEATRHYDWRFARFLGWSFVLALFGGSLAVAFVWVAS